ncbi:MAG: surface-adhesin E family protein [Nitrospira sp.]
MASVFSVVVGPALRKFIGGRNVAVVLSPLVFLYWLGEARVYAEWLLVEANAKATVYVEAETITQHGDLVRAWVLDDLKTGHTRGFSKYLSSRAQEEHDCTNERFRLLSLENFSENMGAGEMVYRNAAASGWTGVPRGTLAHSVWKFVCGKK